jgi:hypothetical protein
VPWWWLGWQCIIYDDKPFFSSASERNDEPIPTQTTEMIALHSDILSSLLSCCAEADEFDRRVVYGVEDGGASRQGKIVVKHFRLAHFARWLHSAQDDFAYGRTEQFSFGEKNRGTGPGGCCG